MSTTIWWMLSYVEFFWLFIQFQSFSIRSINNFSSFRLIIYWKKIDWTSILKKLFSEFFTTWYIMTTKFYFFDAFKSINNRRFESKWIKKIKSTKIFSNRRKIVVFFTLSLSILIESINVFEYCQVGQSSIG